MSKFIEQLEDLEQALGVPVAFHDAEVVSVSIERTTTTGDVTLQIEVFVWRTKQTVTADGFFERDNFAIATLRFERVWDLAIEEFNNQNVILDLSITLQDDGRFRVVLDPPYGLYMTLTCSRIALAKFARVDVNGKSQE